VRDLSFKLKKSISNIQFVLDKKAQDEDSPTILKSPEKKKGLKIPEQRSARNLVEQKEVSQS